MQRAWRAAGCVDSAFLAQLRQQPVYTGIVFRGCPEDCTTAYSPLLSTSTDLDVAKDFALRKAPARPGGICVYLGYEAYAVSRVSVMPEEKEVLCLFTQGYQWKDFVGETYEYAGLPVYIFAPTKELQREAIKLFFARIGRTMPPLPQSLASSAPPSPPPRPRWKQLVKAAALAALVLL
jgi:hypothetical protein